MHMQFASRSIDLSRPRVMGILNVTPDSFYDGGQYFREGKDISNALQQAERMASAGATFLDIGGESTRPGAEAVSEEEELERVIPVIEAICKNIDAVVSVDTSTPAVMTEAAKVGAGLINDVRALSREGAIEAAKQTGLPVCLMHMQGQPGTMQENPHYEDVVENVRDFLLEKVRSCENAGITNEQIILDPGFGFGKNDEHNIALLKGMERIGGEYPVLAGLSRKSILGRLLGRDSKERLAGSLSLAQYALQNGASILRVHDVEETVDIVKLYEIINQG